jgi:hypothetical protein
MGGELGVDIMLDTAQTKQKKGAGTRIPSVGWSCSFGFIGE